MSQRQIRRIQKEFSKETLEVEVPRKLTIVSNRPKFSFSQLNEFSDSDSDSACSDEVVKPQIFERVKDLPAEATKGKPSDDHSDWEKLFDGAESPKSEKCTSSKDPEYSPLFCKLRDFRLIGIESSGMRRTRQRTQQISHSSKGRFPNIRNWLCPGVTKLDSSKFKAICSSQLRICTDSKNQNEDREKFRIVLTDYFREVEGLCLAAVNSQDLELFRRLLETNPFNLEVLVRASRIYTLSGGHEEAFKALSLAVKLFQTSLPHRFSPFIVGNLAVPNVWLPSSVSDNLIAYRLLLLYMISLERQGQWVAALAVCKLLLAMDFPGDITHSLLRIDTYLLNGDDSDEFSSIWRYANAYGLAQGGAIPQLLWVLPNFAFSIPLQIFLRTQIIQKHEDISDLFMQLVQKALLLDESPRGFMLVPLESRDMSLQSMGEDAAQMLLFRAIIQYPRFLKLLEETPSVNHEMHLSTDQEPFSIWDMEDPDLDNEKLLRCYVTNAGDLWKGKNGEFLATVANLVVQIYSKPRGKLLIDSFRDLWTTSCLEISLPFDLESLSINEFDILAHSLPIGLE